MAFDYELRRSSRRTLALEITPEGKLLVRAPGRLSRREIDAFVERNTAWIERTLPRVLARVAAHPAPTPEQERELQARARTELPARVAHYGAIMGLTPAGITITGAQKRFGSCSAKNRLCFSWRLMAYPPEAIDYVVVHELAHMVQKNHGPAFYALVAQVLPDYKARIRLFR